MMPDRRRAAAAAPPLLVRMLLLISLMRPALATRAAVLLQQDAQQQEQEQPLKMSTTTAAAPSAKDDDFDFFFLVRQYPPTFCNDHRCSHSPPRGFAFTIHGLWPQRADGTWPEFCQGPDGGPGGGLSLWRLRDLLPALARAWPSWTLSDRAFWQHEWARHGACAAAALGGPEAAARPGGGQHAFFATVLELHRRYPVERALSAGGIEPSESARYASADLVAAVRRAHGVRPHVTCDFHGQLAEVWYCVAKDGKGAVDCGAGRALAAEGARAAAAAAANGAAVAPPPPSNAFCRTVALPLPARRAGAAVADEAPLFTLAGIVVSAAVAAYRGRQWWMAGGSSGGRGGEGVRRPLVASA